MARKSIKGYAEKNYYDNTKFNGGIVATHDPLNEGYFKHMVNFDISDIGQSITPRRGFITTRLKDVKIDRWSVYFYDSNLGEYIFLNPILKIAWRVKFDVNYNFIDTYTPISNVVSNSYYLYDLDTHQAYQALDEYGVTCYIIKAYKSVEYDSDDDGEDDSSYDELVWLKMYYRLNASEYMGIQYPEDTLVVEELNTQDVVNYVDTNKRNLASSNTIIPIPMQDVYSKEEKPDDHFNKFPMIYIKDSEGKYLINSYKGDSIDNLTIIPNFYLDETKEGYMWAYTYDVIPYRDDISVSLNSTNLYKSRIFSIKDNTLLNTPDRLWLKLYEYIQKNLTWTGTLSTYNLTNYRSYLNSLYTDKYKEFEDLKNSAIIYMVPKHDSSKPTAVLQSTVHYPNTYIPDYLWMAGMHNVTLDDSIRDIMSTLHRSSVPEMGSLYDEVIRNYPGLRYLNYYINNFADNNIWKDTYVTSLETNIPQPDGQEIEQYFKFDLDSFKKWLGPYKDTHNFYIKPFRESMSNFNDITSGNYMDAIQTCAYNKLYANSEPGMSFDELVTYILSNGYNDFVLKTFKNVIKVSVDLSYINRYSIDTVRNTQDIYKLFKDTNDYYLYTNILPTYNIIIRDPIGFDKSSLVPWNSPTGEFDFNATDSPRFMMQNEALFSYLENHLSKHFYDSINSTYMDFFKCVTPNTGIEAGLYSTTDILEVSAMPLISNGSHYLKQFTILGISQDTTTIFSNTDEGLISILNSDNTPYNILNSKGVFNNGIILNMYLMKIPTKEYFEAHPELFPGVKYTREYFINTTNLKQSRVLTLTDTQHTTYIERLKDEPEDIKNSKEYLIFHSILGDHLVTYINNKVYISVENMPYYFTKKFEYPEPIVKVIQYKDMLLVFTTQNLYALYFYEYTTNVENGTNEDGTPKYVQQTQLEFATLPVLYNLMVNEKYKDAIQVYNQMILFYSADGQMFLIKPTAAIDSNTRFSIQYFNKSANDILLNYKDYIQERLNVYGIDDIVEDADIKVTANINYIKIFYSAYNKKHEYLMTYILIYDVLNNRYYVHDTTSFSNIKNIHYIPTGELYITKHSSQLYFTMPYDNIKYMINDNDDKPDEFMSEFNEMDSNIDIASYDNFSPNPIQCELDTGTINLNNHLKKRFKDLRVTYKNLTANDLEFRLETFVDDLPIISYIDSTLEIQDVSGFNTLVVTENNKVEQLIENNALFNFTDYASNKIITHRTNIISRGKTIRFKMHFSSKGKYKIQGYGLIYKEHTV